jgi:hypothetical protein
VLEAGTGVELALAVVLGEPFRAAHRMSVSTSAGQLVERVPPVLGLGHAPLLSSEGDRRTGMFTLTILNCLL